jgi:hypothetical protein
VKASRFSTLIALSALGLGGMVACAPPRDDPPDPATTAKPNPTATTARPTQPTMPNGVPCGWATGAPPAQWDHVVLVIFENKSVAQVFGPTSPATYFQGLPAQCGYASNYWSVWIRSLANYLALTSGSTHGQTVDPPPAEAPIAGDSIFQQLGSDWTVLAESAKENCQMKGGDLYNPRHVPSTYYTAIRSTCATRTIPMTDPPDLSKRFTIVIPNMLHDMHVTDLTVDIPARLKAGDDWLRGYLPKLLATPEYRAGRTLILITFDEGQVNNSNIPLFVISPYVNPGARETRRFDHYSLLRTMQEVMGLSSFLGNAATAPSMRGGPLEI